MKRYMESLCADLRSNTITSVQANNDRVSETFYRFYFFRLVIPQVCWILWNQQQGFKHSVLHLQVSLLLKDSFIDSFSSRDRPFIKVCPFKPLISNLFEPFRQRLSWFSLSFFWQYLRVKLRLIIDEYFQYLCSLVLALQLFIDTQMFSVLSDSRLATFEHEKS